MRRIGKIKRNGIALALVCTLMSSAALISEASYMDCTSQLADNYVNTIIFNKLSVEAGDTTWYDGFTYEMRNTRTGELLEITPTYGRTGAGLGKVELSVPSPLPLNDWCVTDVKDKEGNLICSVNTLKLDDMFTGMWFAESYLKNINMYNSVIRINPIEDETVLFKDSTGAKVVGGIGNAAALDGVTKIPYIGDTGKTDGVYNKADFSAEYTVADAKAGEYFVYYYNYGANGYFGKSDSQVMVNSEEFTTITANTNKTVIELGKVELVEGQNTITISKTAAGDDRLYAGDIWLVPTKIESEDYAGVDIRTVEYWNSEKTQLDTFNGDETVFKSVAVYNAVGNGRTESEKISIVTALYDDNDKLIHAHIESNSITPKQGSFTANKRISYMSNATQGVFGNLGEYTKGTKAKTFIWDATGKLIPLSTDVYDIAKTDAE